MIDILSAIVLLITGVVALVVGIALLQAYLADKALELLFWSISFLVLFIAGVLIIFLGFDVLGEPAIPPIAALIPVGIAAGLLFAIYSEKKTINWIFVAYELIMIIYTAIVRMGGNTDSAMLIMASHIPAGLLIVILPFMTSEDKAWYFFLGGGLVSVGGMLLAFLKLGNPILTADLIFTLLPWILLVAGVCFTLAVIYPEKWRVNVPWLTEKLIGDKDVIH